MPPKSIYRKPGAKHFQLVHRSLRDPLIHDPDAGQHVLREVVRGNNKKGKSRADLEAALGPQEIAHDTCANVGEAALYGIYFDDTEYDYMQHLRTVGAKEEGVESILIEAPSTSQTKTKKKGKVKEDTSASLYDLPPEALPSKNEMPLNFESQQAVPESISGFQPDMDPHLRQVLEALEDDAFVDDSLEDGFFTELVEGGERSDQELEYEFNEDGKPGGVDNGREEAEDANSWEARFAEFKKQMKEAPCNDSDGDVGSEGGDTIGNLPRLPVIGGKQRRKASSVASGYSMSSSSMYRTEALLTLDERFDQLMLKEYDPDEAEGVDGESVTSSDISDSDEAPELITAREDFVAIVDDFMENYEVVGRKLKPVLAGDSGVDKLDTLRRAMGQDERVTVSTAEDADVDNDDDEKLFASYHASDKEDRWDCETILTTYSNLENHPRVIRARMSKHVPKIRLDPHTGLPSVDPPNQKGCGILPKDDEKPLAVKTTVTRPHDESKEDKRARKRAVKAERQAKRVNKKMTREQYNDEARRQSQGLSQKVKNSGIRKL
ncbi:Low temperature viability protein-domain-containing protein [Scleroderma yunnanense]